jgi:hypothetical protein
VGIPKPLFSNFLYSNPFIVNFRSTHWQLLINADRDLVCVHPEIEIEHSRSSQIRNWEPALKGCERGTFLVHVERDGLHSGDQHDH